MYNRALCYFIAFFGMVFLCVSVDAVGDSSSDEEVSRSSQTVVSCKHSHTHKEQTDVPGQGDAGSDKSFIARIIGSVSTALFFGGQYWGEREELKEVADDEADEYHSLMVFLAQRGIKLAPKRRVASQLRKLCHAEQIAGFSDEESGEIRRRFLEYMQVRRGLERARRKRKINTFFLIGSILSAIVDGTWHLSKKK